MGFFDKAGKDGKTGRQRSDSVASGPMLIAPEVVAPTTQRPGPQGATYAQQRQQVQPAATSQSVASALGSMRDPRGLADVGTVTGLNVRVRNLEAGMAHGLSSGQQTQAIALLKQLAGIAKSSFEQSCEATRRGDHVQMTRMDAVMARSVELFGALADKTEEYKTFKLQRKRPDGTMRPAPDTDDYRAEKAAFGAELARVQAAMGTLK